ncbi:transketolase C-terminal domain-containing protein [Herbaspirillum sp. RTI4]|uniref:transketolase family protein n=1 Tax=Herbaspirillum sp. RTI4 TaxID=3048640 RepID=UPI002AB4C6AE|nr:transketolase C-terminal domain-containing protein [Herbaspirillum sp. RTI4]MDY7577036.1 transketolase C-terminal domain-containing protein [Herbaspirillum sp. RTI4]MEA9983107.1 transketolase C-terminal domain-containing protein [Herbaspirillum sp. RTI4]
MSKSLRQQFADTLTSIGKEDSQLVVMVGDISHGILKPFAEACPDRFYNIGILEPTMVSMGAGLAAAGLCPVIHTIAPFLIERSFEQIKLDFCYHKLPGNIVTVGSAFDYSNLGCTHHCYGDFALLKTLQRIQICFPASAIEFDQLFRQAYRNDLLTVYRMAGHPHPIQFKAEDIVFGKAIKIHDGSDVTLIATGPQLKTALDAREKLSARGILAEVIYVHTIRPLDTEMIQASVEKTRKVVVIEEHMMSGGLGDDVLRATYQIPGMKFHSVSIPDEFVTGYGTYEELCESCGLTAEAVITAIGAWE